MKISKIKFMLNSLALNLPKLGIRYFCHLVKDAIIPKTFFVIDSLLKNRLKMVSIYVSITFFSIGLVAFIVLSHIFEAIVLINLAVFVLFIFWLKRKLIILDIKKQAKQLTKTKRCDNANRFFTSLEEISLDKNTKDAIELARKNNPDNELVIGNVDKNGRIFGLFGELPYLESVNKEDFIERKKCKIDMVLIKDNVLVRKAFGNDKIGFLREWYCFAKLFGKANVPAIYHVDESHYTLYVNMITGESVKKAFLNGNKNENNKIPENIINKMKNQLDAIHSMRIANLGIEPDNIIVDPTKENIWFIDFKKSDIFPNITSMAYNFVRDQDRTIFNQKYGGDLLTEKTAREAIVARRAKKEWYSTVDFGNGLTIGPIWSISHGPGRWEFLNKHVLNPIIANKRILDLGSNIGILPMIMLRNGAKEVICLELDKDNVESAKLVHRIYEWRDLKRYAFHINEGNMLNILTDNLGNFDIVTAFCSLYYLEADDMARVIRKASKIANMMVLQANQDSKPTGRSERASVHFLKELLIKNGFPQVEMYAPKGYGRPIVVGMH